MVEQCGQGPGPETYINNWSMTFECKGYNPINDNVEVVSATVPDFPQYDLENDEIPSGKWIGTLDTNATVIETYGDHLEVLDDGKVQLYSDGATGSAILVFITNNNAIRLYGYDGEPIGNSYWLISTPYNLKKVNKEEVE